MSQRCVILYGTMGAGKTTVGEQLADILGYEFIDTDALIEEKEGKSITQIFEEKGEEGFRAIESEVIASLADSEAKVIATGGGAIMDPQNRHVLASLGSTVYLKASPRELYQRIKNDTNRPLLQNAEDPKAEIASLLKKREIHYENSTIVIDTEVLSTEEVADQLIDELAKHTVDDTV